MARNRPQLTVKVNEGDWYAVPLQNGGYAVGVVARTGKRGALFGYFFGPRREQLPTLDEVRELGLGDAISFELFGDLGIQNGKWTRLGRLETWERDKWPLPEFGRIENEATGVAWIINYASGDLGDQPRERRCSVEEARRLPLDRWAGSGAVEIRLTQKLSS